MALWEPEAALVTSGSVLALVTWDVPAARLTSAAAVQGAGSFATEAEPGVEGRNSGWGLTHPLPPRPARRYVENQ